MWYHSHAAEIGIWLIGICPGPELVDNTNDLVDMCEKDIYPTFDNGVYSKLCAILANSQAKTHTQSSNGHQGTVVHWYKQVQICPIFDQNWSLIFFCQTRWSSIVFSFGQNLWILWFCISASTKCKQAENRTELLYLSLSRSIRDICKMKVASCELCC